jgi:hypothetical protein
MDNFRGSASFFADVDAADRWYGGMAAAALERGIAIQYCLPSATDILQSLTLPAVVQARASDDYVSVVNNTYQIGGSALLMGALAIAPSKDTLWTSSPQPPTSSDVIHSGYTTQPHVQLDAVLATLSMGPVGISDALNYTDVGLISQAFRSPSDGTLLRPSRPVSWVDSVFFNASALSSGSFNASALSPGSGIGREGSSGPGDGMLDVRSTHATVPGARDRRAANGSVTTHYVLAWRTATDVTLGPTDLYPPPAAGVDLAVRQHVIAPAGAAQLAGCLDGAPAVPDCVVVVPAGDFVSIPATGTELSNFSLTAVYERLPNGAFFLGELTKFVHVSPQRFEYVYAAPSVTDSANAADRGAAAGETGSQNADRKKASAHDPRTAPLAAAGPAGVVVGVVGSPGQAITLVAVDPQGIVRLAVAQVPAAGFVEVSM